MIAYSNEWLNNLLIREELEIAHDKNLITGEEEAAAIKLYPVNFYTPNIFIRIGLFVLAVIIILFSTGLFFLLFNMESENSVGVILLFFGMVAYVILEIMISKKHHYKSGVDDALMWASAGCILGALNWMLRISATLNWLMVFMIAFYFLLRFTNYLMGAITVIAFLMLVFLTYTKFGTVAKLTAPFLLFVLTVIIYFLADYLSKQKIYRLYNLPLNATKITALLCAYAAVNYFVVREAANMMFGNGINNDAPISFGWLFWALTFFIPAVYIFRGIQKKDAILLRVGLLLTAAIIFTVRYYYAVMPIEIAMLTGGILMISIAYALIKYLRQPKNGFTSRDVINKNAARKLNLEALIISETFGSTNQPVASSTTFGGGSFGGGGASGEF